MFKQIGSQFDQQKIEQEILKFWDKNQIFKKSIETRDPNKSFVFYEGPPTANGTPGIHHVISRTIKDLVCRYKTMQGYRVERKAGWDTHGLPVEIEVEKGLGIDGKEQVLEFGVDKFNQKCKESVFRYKKEWDEVTRRIGFWVDLENPYITYENDYIETVWWILKEFWQRDLIYRSFKILPYCPRCETPLSSHEVAQGYEDVEDPSIYVKIPIKAEPDTYFLVWTTTPWTLISNAALALNPDMDYVKVVHQGQKLILANQRISVLHGNFEILANYKGSELAHLDYEPLFKFIIPSQKAYYTVLADFVTSEEGTGIVHIAPAFGEDDYRLGQKYGLPVIHPVNKSGKFVGEITQFKGKFVKDADNEITADLKSRGLLYFSEKMIHSYPHCWRCDSPLLYYARNSWYIRTTAIKDQLIEINKKIKWYPREVGLGRFGEWLENNVDWSLSRDRFWGTPLNIWICDNCEAIESVGSREELKSKAHLKQDVDLHKPYIDEVTFQCAKCNGVMRRVPEVIDCWFDSGAMPYAQWHYPFEHKEDFDRRFPADFISEGVDQTRGWFYSMLVLGVFLFGKSSYKSCLSIELILDKEGQKMSKSRGNSVNPFEIIENYGADPLRWYLLTVSPPWLPTRFDEEGIAKVIQRFFGTLTNVYSFFALYANIDRFDGCEQAIPIEQRNQIDRWIISKLNALVSEIEPNLSRFEITKSARMISNFVIDDLSNWYVRRCRRRFWKPSEIEADSKMGRDKLSAYQTLHQVLLTISKIIAPFIPFLAEELYQDLKISNDHSSESVHLCCYPDRKQSEFHYRDKELEEKMELILRMANMGRSARNEAEIKIRQPLEELIIFNPHGHQEQLIEGMENLLKEELNVKKIRFTSLYSDLVIRKAEPIYKVIGPKFGKLVNRAAEKIRSLSEADIVRLEKEGTLNLNIDKKNFKIAINDIEIRTEDREGLIVATEEDLTIALNCILTESLIHEGLARDFVNRVQNMRKDANFHVTDRIVIQYEGPEAVQQAITAQVEYIKDETLADKLINKIDTLAFQKEWTINEDKIVIGIIRN